MSGQFAERIKSVEQSTIIEILKLTENQDIISFAGGLPNPSLFPVTQIADAIQKVLLKSGSQALQYGTTEGYRPLRSYIANRYFERFGMRADPEEIIITSGSQQGIDLVGKILLNRGDRLVIERPGYLGAIQALSIYEPVFCPVALTEDGIDIQMLKQVLKNKPVKLTYGVTNFQNPSGITYSEKTRYAIADLLNRHRTVFLEDDPYGELRFEGAPMPPIVSFLEDNGILLGSFSKITIPGIRLGWIYAKKKFMDKLIIAKQAADLHTSSLSQMLIYQFFLDNDLESHLAKIKEVYKHQRDCMIGEIERSFPKTVRITRPLGGMFLWVTLPPDVSSRAVLDQAIRAKIAFVPGKPFFLDGSGDNCLRLNFSNSNHDEISMGIRQLGEVIHDCCNQTRNLGTC